jgi:DnaJ-class molecular chaperone
MSPDQPDPYAVLGLNPDASSVEIAAAYRCAVRACHPDTSHPNRDRLAAVIAAYRQLRDQRGDQDAHPSAGHHQRSAGAADIPVRIHHRSTDTSGPDLRAGPVRRHQPQH